MNNNDHSLDPNQVEHFLRENPDFFSDKDELLVDMRIPHGAGNAVSLVEKQLVILRERNADLRNRMTELIGNARENDRLFNLTKRLVLALLDTKNLAQATDLVYSSFATDFNIQTTQIVLFSDTGMSRAKQCSLESAQTHVGRFLKARQTVGGGLSQPERDFIFDDNSEKVGSAALAILAYGEIYGLLAIGHEDPEYYKSGLGTMFLSYIAEVYSRIIRNARQPS
jgi:uncharacterized protein YigA (DUF484 family)